MGEVYRARDTRLERTVAVKVLPSHLSASPEVRQRFEREAKTISQLSHPHICALYDVGNQDGVEFLVMEYLEGETLSNRLVKGPLAFDQVLRYGLEIADTLRVRSPLATLAISRYRDTAMARYVVTNLRFPERT